MHLNAVNNAPQFPGCSSIMPSHYHLLVVPPLTKTSLSVPTGSTHRSVLLDLLVVGDDLPDAVNEAALVVGDEAHEYSLLGRVEQH